MSRKGAGQAGTACGPVTLNKALFSHLHKKVNGSGLLPPASSYEQRSTRPGLRPRAVDSCTAKVTGVFWDSSSEWKWRLPQDPGETGGAEMYCEAAQCSSCGPILVLGYQ